MGVVIHVVQVPAFCRVTRVAANESAGRRARGTERQLTSAATVGPSRLLPGALSPANFREHCFPRTRVNNSLVSGAPSVPRSLWCKVEARQVKECHKERDGKDEPIEQHLARPLALFTVCSRVAPKLCPRDSPGAQHYEHQ
jgi:hypothetical protein